MVLDNSQKSPPCCFNWRFSNYEIFVKKIEIFQSLGGWLLLEMRVAMVYTEIFQLCEGKEQEQTILQDKR